MTASSRPQSPRPTPDIPATIGRYTLLRRLGEGGMGVVYVARDERLQRDVAVKMIAGLSNDSAIKRFWREARAAAAINHPNICQIYEVDEAPGGIYLAMELLEGEALDVRLRRAPCGTREAVAITLQILAALGALHARDLVHRDIKPSNVFLTAHGVKLLDFGLARSISDDTVQIESPDPSDITQPGMVVGTPRYMAPEQISGRSIDGRADLYAVGCVLFEMLAGRPPFTAENLLELARAVVHDNPPALQGPPSVVRVDRVIRRALAKDASARFPVAEAMATELRNIPLDEDDGTRSVMTARALLRIVMPPLRLQREDPDSSYLSYGLAEAVSGSLASLRDVAVRSPALAAKWGTAEGDLRRISAEADVDVIVSGSLARMGDQLRATLQLVEAGSGNVLGGTSVRGSMNEIFEFEDQLTQAAVKLLTPMRADSASGAERKDVPANAEAFQEFLRGLELARSMTTLAEARVCFQKALDHDPAFAPAWAWIGRCHRVIGKYIEHYEENDRRAAEAFQRALALSPELPTAHRFFTHFESEHGRADAAIARLLQHSRANRNDAQLFAALVHACRYAGLLDESVAAHEEAKRLDPTVPTSIEYTLLQLGDEAGLRATPGGGVDVDGALFYQLLFQRQWAELRERLDRVSLEALPIGYRWMVEALFHVDSDPQGAIQRLRGISSHGTRNDPEAVFLMGAAAAVLGDTDGGLAMVAAAVQQGYSALLPLERVAAFAALRDRGEYGSVLDLARQRQRIARAVFERGGGKELLGLD